MLAKSGVSSQSSWPERPLFPPNQAEGPWGENWHSWPQPQIYSGKLLQPKFEMMVAKKHIIWRVSCSEWRFDYLMLRFCSLEGNCKVHNFGPGKSLTNQQRLMLDHDLTSSTRIVQATSKSAVVLVGNKVYKVGVGSNFGTLLNPLSWFGILLLPLPAITWVAQSLVNNESQQ